MKLIEGTDQKYPLHLRIILKQCWCGLTTKKIHPKELIGWRIGYMNQGFMPILQHNRRPDYMNYAIAEAPPPPLQPKRSPQWNRGYYS